MFIAMRLFVKTAESLAKLLMMKIIMTNNMAKEEYELREFSDMELLLLSMKAKRNKDQELVDAIIDELESRR